MDQQNTSSPQRRTTGVPGLDTVLQGGLPPGSVYIVRGAPGAGKTILANQICFHRASLGERCLYVTLLAESHDRLLGHLQGMSFFDGSRIPDSIYYESGFGTLQNGGLDGILRLLSSEQRAQRASLIILDGLFVIEEHMDSEKDFRRFINSLENLASLTGCSYLLLTNSSRGPESPEYTMVDGWFEVGVERLEYRTHRYLQVHKYRGSGFIGGRHTLTISDGGARIYPRLETSLDLPKDRPRARHAPRVGSGVPGLDAMLTGGLRSESSTLVVGPTGIGKTALGLQFLSECGPDEPGLLFGFFESQDDLLEKAEVLGLDLEPRFRAGQLQLCWHPPTEHSLDVLGYTLLEECRRRGVRRLLVDSLDALHQAAVYPDRLGRFLAALTRQLRAEGVTSMYTLETPALIGGRYEVEVGALSAVAQNIILMRYLELGSRIRRTLSVIKSRSSGFDASIREFEITRQGIHIGEPLPCEEDLLTGHAHHRGGDRD